MNAARPPLLMTVCLLLFAACSGAETPPRDGADPSTEQIEQLGRGEAIAETLCSTCHTLDAAGASPHPEAIPLRELSSNYPVRSLRAPLSAGIVVGHPDMPEWQFEPQDVEALLAFLESIQEAQPI